MRVPAALLSALLLAACSKKDGDASLPPPLPPTLLAAVLSGAQEAPASATAATGALSLSVSADGSTIDLTLTTTVSSPTAAHLHAGGPGVNGAVLFPLAAAFASPLSGTLTAANFTPGGGIATFADAVAAILAGSTYVNVHSGAFPNGEVRGQVGPASVASARLSGAQEIPAVTTAGTGTATFTLNGTQTAISFSLTVSGLSSAVTAAHLHLGEAGTEGNPMFTLASAAFTGTITGTLTAAEFTAGPGVATFAEAVNALLGGLTYVNVHTVGFSGGEIRGQAGSAQLGSTLGGAQEVPAVATAGAGAGLVVLNGLQNAAAVTLTYASLAGTTTAAHIHLEEPGIDGPILISLASAAFASPLTAGLASTDITPANVDALLSGATYFNIHTTSASGGEIRGQIGAVTGASVRLSGAQEVGGVAGSGTGSATFILSGSQTSIAFSLTVSGLSSTVTAAHLHAGEEGVNGGAMWTLAPGAFTGTVTGTLTPLTFGPAPGQGVNTYAAAVNAILGGLTYVNVHTAVNTGGEIRGQVGAARLDATLDGAQEVPPVTTTGTGTGAVALNGLQTRATVTLAYSALTGTATDAHIHQGPVGVDGSILITLATGGVPTPLTVNLTSGDVTPANVDFMLSGLAYFNIHSTTQAGGEIRGQIVP